MKSFTPPWLSASQVRSTDHRRCPGVVYSPPGHQSASATTVITNTDPARHSRDANFVCIGIWIGVRASIPADTLPVIDKYQWPVVAGPTTKQPPTSSTNRGWREAALRHA